MNRPIFNQVSLESYQAAQSERVHEEDIRSNEQYLMAAQLETRDGTQAGEFHLKTARVIPEAGRIGLIACLYDPNDEEPFLLLAGNVSKGIITPNRPNGLHVTHPETGSLGLLQEGFLLAHPQTPAHLGGVALRTLHEHAALEETAIRREYTDTRTGVFERQGILLGYN